MKKYFRNRYHSFLQALRDQKQRKEQEVEECKKTEERRKEKLRENLGVNKVQSRFLEEKQAAAEE